MLIRTTFSPTSLPDRQYDWTAVDVDTYDGAEDSSTKYMVGYGATEEEAILDLKRLHNEMMECAEDDERRNMDGTP